MSIEIRCPGGSTKLQLPDQITDGQTVAVKCSDSACLGSYSVKIKTVSPLVYSFLAECPECGAKIELTSDVEESEVVSCSDCGVELEVAEVKPAIVLKIAPAEAEDWGQ